LVCFPAQGVLFPPPVLSWEESDSVLLVWLSVFGDD
jgi:hypothetical protein